MSIINPCNFDPETDIVLSYLRGLDTVHLDKGVDSTIIHVYIHGDKVISIIWQPMRCCWSTNGYDTVTVADLQAKIRSRL